MKKRIFLIWLFLIILNYSSKAQVSFKAQIGISYIEHFSTGITLSLLNKHNISLLYGSNIFIKPQEFSSFLIQYEMLLNKIKIRSITPKFGIKGGYSIYTNNYYQWELVAVVPFIGLNYPVKNKVNIALDLGVAVSRELTLKRISYGEIGEYKQFLPELKIGIFFNL